MPLHSQFRSIWSVELEKTSTTHVDALEKPRCMAPSSYIVPFHNHRSETTSAFHSSDSPNVIDHLQRCRHDHRTLSSVFLNPVSTQRLTSEPSAAIALRSNANVWLVVASPFSESPNDCPAPSCWNKESSCLFFGCNQLVMHPRKQGEYLAAATNSFANELIFIYCCCYDSSNASAVRTR